MCQQMTCRWRVLLRWALAVGLLCVRMPTSVSASLPIEAAPYSEMDARLFLRFAAVSVCSDHAIRNWSCGGLCEDLSSRVVSGSQQLLGPTARFQVRGFVVALQGHGVSGRCVASFAGTSFLNIDNLLADAFAWRVAWPNWGQDICGDVSWCPGCAVHDGFADAYGELRGELRSALDRAGCTSMTVVGHSLGAAIAVLASMELRACGPQRVHDVWTYGLPRVGTLEFTEAYEVVARMRGAAPSLWRVVHYHDTIPRLAPYWTGYRHLGLEVYYTTENSTTFQVCTASSDRPENIDCMLAVWPGTMADHHNYLGGDIQTDEMKVSTDCISNVEMEAKKSAWDDFLTKAGVVVVLLLGLLVGSCCWCWRCTLPCCRARTLDRKGGRFHKVTNDDN